MRTEELEKARLLTRYFGEMQGLRTVPIGVFLLMDAGFIWMAGNTALLDAFPLATALGVFGVVVAVGASFVWVNRYYRSQVGEVRLAVTPGVKRARVLLVLGMVGAVLLDVFLRAPVLVSGAVFCGVVWAGLAQLGKARKEYFWAGLLLGLTAFLPLLGLSHRDSLNALIGLAGLVLIVSGLQDHQKLVRMLGRQGVGR